MIRRSSRWNSPSRCRVDRRDGITLLELVAASALAVLMMATISGVLRSMHQRTQAMMEDDASGRSWRDGLLDRLEWDLANSREMITSTKELRLRGFCGRDPVVRECTHRLVEVAYELRDIDGQSCLVRTERLMDSGAAGLHNVELMGVGITGLVLLGREEGEDRGGLEGVDIVPTSEERLLGGKPGATRTWLPVPRVCRLSLLGTNRHSVADRLIVF